TEPARGDRADRRAVLRFDLGSFARGHAAFRPQADALPARTVAQFREHALGAGKSALLAPALLDRPSESGFDRRGAGVNVVTVEAKARFEAQRIAGAKPDRLDLGMAEQALGDGAHAVRLHGNLVAVLAGVARAADVTIDAVEARATRRHESHRGGSGGVPLEHRGCLGPLQRDERAMIGADQPHSR